MMGLWKICFCIDFKVNFCRIVMILKRLVWFTTPTLHPPTQSILNSIFISQWKSIKLRHKQWSSLNHIILLSFVFDVALNWYQISNGGPGRCMSIQILRAPDHSGIFMVGLRPKSHFYQAPTAVNRLQLTLGLVPAVDFLNIYFKLLLFFIFVLSLFFKLSPHK